MKYRQICPECNEIFVVEEIKNKIAICPKCGGRRISYEKLISITDDKETLNDSYKTKEIESDSNKDILDLLNAAKESFENNSDEYGVLNESERIIELVTVGTYGNRGFVIKISSVETPVLIGRCGLGKDFLQEDLRVSNEHCYINYDNGKWYLTDNNSTNSTELNDKTISPGNPCLIKENDLIRLGKDDNTFVFKVVER